jgi:chromosome segregation ATPase
MSNNPPTVGSFVSNAHLAPKSMDDVLSRVLKVPNLPIPLNPENGLVNIKELWEDIQKIYKNIKVLEDKMKEFHIDEDLLEKILSKKQSTATAANKEHQKPAAVKLDAKLLSDHPDLAQQMIEELQNEVESLSKEKHASFIDHSVTLAQKDYTILELGFKLEEMKGIEALLRDRLSSLQLEKDSLQDRLNKCHGHIYALSGLLKEKET